MAETRILYAVRAGGDKPVEVLEYPILNEDDASYYIELNPDDRRAIPITKNSLMVRPKEARNATMMGLDKDALISRWNKSVKKCALTQLRPYLEILVQEKKAEQPGPAQYVQTEGAAPIPAGAPVPAPAVERVLAPASAAEPQAKSGEASPYPRACAMSWNSVDAFLTLWVTTHFNAVSSAFARPVHGTYGGGREGWSIVLENLEPGDRTSVASILAQHDLEQEISLDKEWPDGETPAGNSLSLTTSISDHIMGNEILPGQDPAFKDGVVRSIATPADIIFLTDGITL